MTAHTQREGNKLARKVRAEAKRERQRQRQQEKLARRRLKAEQREGAR
jgi:hypothetical protein